MEQNKRKERLLAISRIGFLWMGVIVQILANIVNFACVSVAKP
jgi:hypothetical protein